MTPYRASAIALWAALFLVTCTPARAAQLQVGVETTFAAGEHVEYAGITRAVVGYPMGYFSVASRRWAFSFEGFPPIALQSERGRLGTSLGFSDGMARFSLDPRGRMWLGAGELLINQSTAYGCGARAVYLGCQQQQSRVSGGRYELSFDQPAKGQHFVALEVTDAPRLTATVHFLFADRRLQAFNAPEQGSMSDVTGRFGIRTRTEELSLGVRAINYRAWFVKTGIIADRNVGAGLTMRYLHTLGR